MLEKLFPENKEKRGLMDDILVARDTEEESTRALKPVWGQTPVGARQAGGALQDRGQTV